MLTWFFPQAGYRFANKNGNMETVSPWLFRKDLTLTCLDSTRGVKWPALGVVVGRVVVRAWNPVGGGGFNDDKCLMYTPQHSRRFLYLKQ